MWYNVNRKSSHYEIDFRTTGLKLMPTLEASVFSVNEICKKYPGPYNCMASGGVDSQSMLYAWKLSGKPFNATAVRYNNTLNNFDLIQLEQFCDRENIHIHYIDFDLLSFLLNDYDTWAHRYMCSSPQITTHMKMTEGLLGTCIFSGDLVRGPVSGIAHAQMGIYRYQQETQRPIVPFFYWSTPELVYSYKTAEKKFCMDATDFPSWQQQQVQYQVKCQLLQTLGFPVIPQTTKYSGFELTKDYYDEKYHAQVSTLSRLKYARKPSKRVFDLLLRYPYEDVFGDIPYQFLMNIDDGQQKI